MVQKYNIYSVYNVVLRTNLNTTMNCKNERMMNGYIGETARYSSFFRQF